MDMIQSLRAIAEPLVTGMGLDFEGLEYLPSKPATLRIYVDQQTGVTCDHCQAVSRAVGAAIEVSNLIKTAYLLEVSSPGLDRILFNSAQYAKQLGQHVHCRLKTPLNGKGQFKGVLSQVTEDGKIGLIVDDHLQLIDLSEIEQTRVVPQW